MKGSLEQLTVESAALAGNPLGDVTSRPLLAYLPPGYHESSERYPAVYFLHGFTGSALNWRNNQAFMPSVPERLDELVAKEVIPPVLGIFPDGWSGVGGSQWINSPAIGAYRDYLIQDVVGFVDRTLRTVPRAAGRAVVGESSGGYGALVIARHHPDVFAHVGCHAGDAYFEYCYLPDFPKAAGPLRRAGGVVPWIEDFWRRAWDTKPRSDDFSTINIVAMSAAYSPSPDAPMGIDLPFDLETARLREEVWQRWLAHDPVRFIPQSLDSFRQLESLFVDAGTRDDFNLQWGARQLRRALEEGGVPHQYEEFDDGHMGIKYRYSRSVSLLAPRLARS